MRTVTAFIACLVLASQAFGQIKSTATTKYILSGVDGYTLIGETILLPEGSRPIINAVGFVVIDSDAAMISVKASDAKRTPVEVQKVESTNFLVLGQGKLWIDVTVIDFERKIFDQSQFVIEVGKSPDPEPEPEPDNPDPPPAPDVPEDEFDNIGQRVDSAARGMAKRAEAAAVYREAAAKLVSVASSTVNSVSNELVIKLAALLGPEWASVRKLLNDDLKSRWNDSLGKDWLADYYRAIAFGLEAGQ